MSYVKTGLEKFIESPPNWIKGKRIGLLCNPASIASNYHHARELINEKLPNHIKAIFSPQHGFYAEKQDNMIESQDRIDSYLKVPIFSLYGKIRIPTYEMFDLIDVLIVDIQDVGTRVYTFIYTMSYCMEKAKEFNKKILILDRPNPVNGIDVEGNILSLKYSSFVGRYPIPMRHGLTIGEIAKLFNEHFKINCDLTVITMENWERKMYFNDTNLPWVAPSPNLPTPASAMVYPGQVMWEGTNVSEGRGTTQPFEFFGAPFINHSKILSIIKDSKIKGVYLRPIAFEPTSNKWMGNLCNGFQIHITNPQLYKPYLTSLILIQALLMCHSQEFSWKMPPYEYEFEKMPIDLIVGDDLVRKKIENMENIKIIEESWQKDLNAFKQLKKEFHLYK
ncbi:MAG: DUF1343 domain-containing protein [Desulfobacterales bacterium]|nr:DUF1343 domain-containing protein [Desulfobacterales bacterium]